MTTYTLTGFLVTEVGEVDTGFDQDVTVSVFVNEGVAAAFSYTGSTFTDSEGDVIVETTIASPDGTVLSLEGAPSTADLDDVLFEVRWGDGRATSVLSFNSVDFTTQTDLTWIFELGGDILPEFTSSAELDAFDDLITSTGLSTDPGLQPGTDILLSSLRGVVISENDIVETRDEDDVIASGVGNDRITSGAGSDTVTAGDGADTVIAGSGNDHITGGSTAADLRDVLYGGSGNDTIDGGYGNDELRGDAGDDILAGGFGTDTVIGGTGNDAMTGSAFSDLIFGGDGNDFVNGGFGSDRVNGGADADRFYHLGIADHGSDWIQDFSSAEGDILFFGGTGSINDFQVNLANTDSAGSSEVDEAFIIYRPTQQIIWALVDGDAQSSITLRIGSEDFELLA